MSGPLMETANRIADERNELLKALKRVLEVGRGTSGRLIIEFRDEVWIKAVIAKVEGR